MRDYPVNLFEHGDIFSTIVPIDIASVQSNPAETVILMSQNRESAKERAKAEMDFAVNLKNEVNIQTLVRELGEFRLETMQRVELIEQALKVAGGASSS